MKLGYKNKTRVLGGCESRVRIQDAKPGREKPRAEQGLPSLKREYGKEHMNDIMGMWQERNVPLFRSLRISMRPWSPEMDGPAHEPHEPPPLPLHTHPPPPFKTTSDNVPDNVQNKKWWFRVNWYAFLRYAPKANPKASPYTLSETLLDLLLSPAFKPQAIP